MIYIIRHGKTERNQANVLQGRSDYPLNDEGIRQAEAAADRLRNIRFDHVFSSPLTRAVQTAKIVVPDLEPVIDERLIEMDYGPYEGTDLNRLPPEILFFFRESSVTERAGSFLDRIRLLQGNILISTHAIAMKGLLETLTPESNGSFWSQFIGNCAIYTAENGGGRIGIPRELKSLE